MQLRAERFLEDIFVKVSQVKSYPSGSGGFAIDFSEAEILLPNSINFKAT